MYRRGFFSLNFCHNILEFFRRASCAWVQVEFYVKCDSADLIKNISYSFLNSLTLVLIALNFPCYFALTSMGLAKKKECSVFSDLPWTLVHISSSHLFPTTLCEPNIFHSHSFLFRSTSVGFCPESQRAPLFSRKCRCHNMRPRHFQRLQSDLGPVSCCPPCEPL